MLLQDLTMGTHTQTHAHHSTAAILEKKKEGGDGWISEG